MCFYPEPNSYSRSRIKVKLDLSNYATKSEVKKAAGVDTSEFAKNTNSLDVDKLKAVPTDLSKLSNAVEKDVAKKILYVELVKKGNTIDSNKQNLEKKIEDVDQKIPNTGTFIVT